MPTNLENYLGVELGIDFGVAMEMITRKHRSVARPALKLLKGCYKIEPKTGCWIWTRDYKTDKDGNLIPLINCTTIIEETKYGLKTTRAVMTNTPGHCTSKITQSVQGCRTETTQPYQVRGLIATFTPWLEWLEPLTENNDIDLCGNQINLKTTCNNPLCVNPKHLFVDRTK